MYSRPSSGDAARSELAGDVAAKASGGVIRYRVWPARRHPLRLACISLTVVAATIAAAILTTAFWALIVFIGFAFVVSTFFFPTEVTLDGDHVIIRRLGQTHIHELRQYRRIERSEDVVDRVELLRHARISPLDPIEGLIVPLPEHAAMAERVLQHLARWVGRTPTGRFAIDVDLAPEDSLEPD